MNKQHTEFPTIATDYFLKQDPLPLSPADAKIKAAKKDELYQEAAKLYSYFSQQALEKQTQNEREKVRKATVSLNKEQKKQFKNQAYEFPNLVATPASEEFSPQELYLRNLYFKRNSANLGAELENVYNPNDDAYRAKSLQETSIASLMAAGAHLGHVASLWSVHTQPFIYGRHKDLMIIDLNQTLTYLKRACKVVEGIAEKGGVIVYVGTRDGQKKSLELAAKRSNGYYVAKRWIPGTITNCIEISGRWERCEVDMADKPTARSLDEVEKSRLIKPDLVIVLNPEENMPCLTETLLSKVPSICVIDTDMDPRMCTYPIPANDDSVRCTDLIVGVLSRAAQNGVQKRLAAVTEYKEGLEAAAN
ncbi:hypothetical protein BABINDRAFT_61788 [Babjeviella inositovora NRRL Y-12698]|uniref:Ribosomal protein S2 n=1 Tax=Babjeviella inositovora NRRL Y-12698 TaxID=984486 RepID=A0A1E3QRX7_9ASCO|nr:uncharacterized protein BABINDRAFT_61788 [Babjeviella inositovora NRRL Y-12698]ODQ80453.1 hypothetical protein BABINDRAFT_61788 [Babjeviella inositovora NRRL Y-12698]